MGWTYCYKLPNQSVKSFFEKEFMGDDGVTQLVDLAVVELRTAYAAYRTGDGRVVAFVILLDYSHPNYGFGYKDVDEGMGPCECKCPERIYKLLTPLQKDDGYAADWRRRVEEYHARRKAVPSLKNGDRVKFATPIDFGPYGILDTFKVVRQGQKVNFQAGYVQYNVTGWRDRAFEVLSTV